ncbi:hypothetical protein MRB53_041591 [Persea americana]|nr:hypothetical protein MRB53_041591 [Persea americana]
MARLNTRPSHARSVTPALSQLSVNDQENMDPAHHDKGKERARDTISINRENTAEELDVQRAQKRRRVDRSHTVEASAEDLAEEEELNAEERKFVKYFDPNQAPEEQRAIKQKIRALGRDVLDRRDELLKDDGSGLTHAVKKADTIFKSVKQTGDATLDSRFLVDVSDIAFKKSATLVSGDNSTGVDVDEFLTKCLAYMRTGGTATQQSRPRASQRIANDESDAEDEDNGGPLDWRFLGRHACYPYNSRPPVPTFLLGPLSLIKKQRAATQRRKRTADTGQETRPEALSREDLTQSEQSSLTAQVSMIRKSMKKHIKTAEKVVMDAGITTPEAAKSERGKRLMKEQLLAQVNGNPGVPLFHFVINPQSFGQTVENLFYVSFLIKEGAAGLGIEDDVPILCKSSYSITLASANFDSDMANPLSIEEKRDKNINKHQAILALDYKTWRDLIAVYKIEKSMIPHREAEAATQLGSRGWYG